LSAPYFCRFAPLLSVFNSCNFDALIIFKPFNMRKLFVKMSMSLDGFVATENGNMDWVFRSSDEQSRNWAVSLSEEAGLIIMGRKSFHQMAPYWPGAQGPFAAPMNSIQKAVFTLKGYDVDSSLSEEIIQLPTAATWAGARVFSGDLTSEIQGLKQEEGKPVMAIGGADFVQSLLTTGEVDQLQLAIHPVILGSGLSIFTGVTQQLDLKLLDVKSFPGGIVVHTYQPTYS